MSASAGDHYDILGVARTATAAQVRSAYFKAMREHPPESEPDTFRLLSDAYRTLSHPERRKLYDAEERVPPEVEVERDRLRLLAEEDPPAAARGLRALVSKYPRLRTLRFQLGVTLDGAERFPEAIPIFRELFREEPTSAVYATWLGDALRRSGRTAEGVELLQEAIVLDGRDTGPYSCLARHYAENGEHDRALGILDRAVRADGKIDLTDLPLLIHRLYILGGKSDWEGLRTAVSEVVALVPREDADATSYVGGRLFEVAKMFDDGHRADLASEVLEGLLRLQPNNAAVLEAVESLRPAAARMRERIRLLDRQDTPGWVKAFVAGFTFPDVSDADRSSVVENIARELSARRAAMRAEWQSCKTRHPAVLGELQPIWDKFLELHSGGAGVPATNNADSSGWLGLIILVGIIFIAAKGCS